MSTLKKLLLASSVACASVANAQIHPLAFGPRPFGAGNAPSNWYADYVGLRFLVTHPSSISGPKVYTHPGTGTTPWGGTVTSAITDVPIQMAALGGDTLAAAAYSAGSFAGKIALVYRGGGIEFVCKAVNAQAGGATAVVIVNNQVGGPIPMGSGTMCSTAGLTIPAFMISKEDGDAIMALYRSGADTARFTITPWGIGASDDIGFVPGAFAGSHAYAIPSNQLGATGNPAEYSMKNGAFVANYGTSTLTNVSLTTVTKFFPGGTGSGTVVHRDTCNLPTFTVADSIFALFDTLTGEFDLAASGPGRFDVEYTLSHSVSPDGFVGDNTDKISFYVTDSLYSKGRYDFVKDEPVRSISYRFGETGDPFIWGPMYFVKNGGNWLKSVKYSVSAGTTVAAGTPLGTTVNLFLFKWTDGTGGAADGVMQDGEMELKSLGVHTLSNPGDTSGASLTFRNMGDPSTGAPMAVPLDAGWYYLGVELGSGFFLGADGMMQPYPRIYSRVVASGTLDYASLVRGSGSDIGTDASVNNGVMPSTYAAFVGSVDTFSFTSQKGLIPAVAMVANNIPPIVDAVYETAKVDTRVNVFPNPAKDVLHVSLSLDNSSKKVTYTIIDGLGRYVSKEVHEGGVKEENFDLNISKLASGNYYLIVNTDSKAIARKFVVTK